MSLRILWVNRMVFMERGGGETFDLEMARHVRGKGHQVFFLGGRPCCAPARENTALFPFPHALVRSPYWGWFPWDRVKGGWRLRVFDFWCFEQLAARWAWRHRDQFDIIQVCELPLFVRLWKKWKARPPVVMRLTAGNFYDKHGAVNAADGIVASGMTVDQLRREGRPDVVDIPNAVDAGLFHPHESRWRSAMGWSAEDVILLYVARFQAFKNHELLLEAFRLFMEDWVSSGCRKSVRLVLAGGGPLQEKFRAECRDSAWASAIVFLGEVPFEKLPGLYAAADIKVITSHFESFCFAALEAMASGLPLVTTECGWVPRLIAYFNGMQLPVQTDGGWVVPLNDAPALARVLRTAVDRPDVCREMGQWNRRKAETAHGWANSANRLLAFYEQMLAQKADAGESVRATP